MEKMNSQSSRQFDINNNSVPLQFQDFYSAERALTSNYEHASDEKSCIECLIKLAELFLQSEIHHEVDNNLFLPQKNYAKSVKFIMAGFILYEKSENNLKLAHEKQSLIDLKNRVIKHFYAEYLLKLADEQQGKRYIHYRNALKAMRFSVEDKLKDPEESTQEILAYINRQLTELLKQMLEDCMAVLGVPPCQWAIVLLGSLAKNEASTHSDAEMILFIKDEQHRKYFTQLVKFLELQMNFLGENPPFKGITGKYSHHWVDGFCLDLITQKPDIFINTPEKLRDFESPEIFPYRSYLANIRYLAGDEALVRRYQASIAISQEERHKIAFEILDLTINFNFNRAQNLEKKEIHSPFNIKIDMFRIPSGIVAALALYFNIGESDTWKRLEKFRSFMSEEAHKNLVKLIEKIIHYRIKIHLHYKKACEDVYHPNFEIRLSEEQKKTIYHLTDDDIQTFVDIYRILLPLKKAAEQFYNTKDDDARKVIFQNTLLYDDSFFNQAGAHAAFHNWEEANKLFKQALALEPNNSNIMYGKAVWLREQGKLRMALDALREAIELAKTNKNSSEILKYLPELAFIYYQIGSFSEGMKALEEVQTYSQPAGSVSKLSTKQVHFIIQIKQLKIAYLMANQDYNSAWECANEVLSFQKNNLGPNDIVLAHTWNCLSNLYHLKNNTFQAMSCAKEAIRIVRRHSTRLTQAAINNDISWELRRGGFPTGLDRGTLLTNLALQLKSIGDIEGAKEFFLKALELFEFYLNQREINIPISHVNYGTLLTYLGDVWLSTEDEMSITLFRKKIRILNGDDPNEKIFDIALENFQKEFPEEQDFRIALCYHKRGKAYSRILNFDVAMQSYAKALSIYKKIKRPYFDILPELYIDMIELEIYQNEHGPAAAYCRKAIDVYDKSDSAMHRIKCRSMYERLATIHLYFNEPEAALETCENALNAFHKNYRAEVEAKQLADPNVFFIIILLAHARAKNVLSEINAIKEFQSILNDVMPLTSIWQMFKIDFKRALIEAEKNTNQQTNFFSVEGFSIGRQNAFDCFTFRLVAARIHFDIAKILSQSSKTNDLQIAISHYKEALMILEKMRRDKSETHIILLNLGDVYRKLENPKKAISYYEKSLNVLPKKNTEQVLLKIFLLQQLAGLYELLKDMEKTTCYQTKVNFFWLNEWKNFPIPDLIYFEISTAAIPSLPSIQVPRYVNDISKLLLHGKKEKIKIMCDNIKNIDVYLRKKLEDFLCGVQEIALVYGVQNFFTACYYQEMGDYFTASAASTQLAIYSTKAIKHYESALNIYKIISPHHPSVQLLQTKCETLNKTHLPIQPVSSQQFLISNSTLIENEKSKIEENSNSIKQTLNNSPQNLNYCLTQTFMSSPAKNIDFINGKRSGAHHITQQQSNSGPEKELPENGISARGSRAFFSML
jgi:tetratricopeptide (TPR) repeat protein